MSEIEEPSTVVQLSVDSVTNPNGTPLDVLDLDLGFVIRGKVTAPNVLTGSGEVRVYAQQRGGPVDRSIGSDSLTFAHSAPPGELGTKDYLWSVVIPPHSDVLPEPQGSTVYEITVVFTHDQLPDIVKFVQMGSYMVN